ncbi:ADP-ribosylglycohydrolase family protein [Nannocystis pusilla]|uniref:ADP-ribosylglycohydrolase family protein n=1 Tax=Nannocystis pusilla TaxID=889268 RepID=UPI003B802FDA
MRGSGYVVHCLEVSLWCAANHPSYEKAVLAAINLGEDTDTTAAVTGALAGAMHGQAAIPEVWLRALASREYVETICARLVERIEGEPAALTKREGRTASLRRRLEDRSEAPKRGNQ